MRESKVRALIDSRVTAILDAERPRPAEATSDQAWAIVGVKGEKPIRAGVALGFAVTPVSDDYDIEWPPPCATVKTGRSDLLQVNFKHGGWYNVPEGHTLTIRDAVQ